MRRSLVIAALVLLVPAARTRAQARPPTPPLGPEPSSSRWQPQWPRFHWAEGVVTVAAEAAAITIYFTADRRDVGWLDPAPLDPELRDALRLRAIEDRSTVMQVSDVILYAMLAWPIAVDSLLLAGVVHGDTDVMLQTLLIDLETLALAHLVTWLTNRFVGRVRPRHVECAVEGTCADRGVGPVASFASGHTLMTHASAGLTCVHHIHHPWLLGGPEGAAIACTSALTLAAAVGAMRIMTDLHWASDVALSAMIGSAIGWGVPLALHYLRPAIPRVGDVALIVSPGPGEAPLGLSVSGVF